MGGADRISLEAVDTAVGARRLTGLHGEIPPEGRRSRLEGAVVECTAEAYRKRTRPAVGAANDLVKQLELEITQTIDEMKQESAGLHDVDSAVMDRLHSLVGALDAQMRRRVGWSGEPAPTPSRASVDSSTSTSSADAGSGSAADAGAGSDAATGKDPAHVKQN